MIVAVYDGFNGTFLFNGGWIVAVPFARIGVAIRSAMETYWSRCTRYDYRNVLLSPIVRVLSWHSVRYGTLGNGGHSPIVLH